MDTMHAKHKKWHRNYALCKK
uniref:Uncharacterized protein n=1 Tax=Anguilla anguilla TaxID=7936 RepID=A0A0E9UMT6_ANGAN